MKLFPDHLYQVNNSLERLELSVEAIVPFLRHYNRDPETALLITKNIMVRNKSFPVNILQGFLRFVEDMTVVNLS